jgi:hypothetical protein
VFLSPVQAAAIARHARQLHRSGAVSHAQWCIFDCLLWTARKPGSAVTTISYSTIQRLARVARGTVAAALEVFERLGLVRRLKRRGRFTWGGSVASRQLMNAYVFQPAATESADRGEKRVQIHIEVEVGGAEQAQTALAQVRATMEQRLLARKPDREFVTPLRYR